MFVLLLLLLLLLRGTVRINILGAAIAGASCDTHAPCSVQVQRRATTGLPRQLTLQHRPWHSG